MFEFFRTKLNIIVFLLCISGSIFVDGASKLNSYETLKEDLGQDFGLGLKSVFGKSYDKFSVRIQDLLGGASNGI